MVLLGALADSLLAVFEPETVLTILVLSSADAAQTKYLKGRLGRVESRVERVEDVFIATDGGQPEDDPAD